MDMSSHSKFVRKTTAIVDKTKALSSHVQRAATRQTEREIEYFLIDYGNMAIFFHLFIHTFDGIIIYSYLCYFVTFYSYLVIKNKVTE